MIYAVEVSRPAVRKPKSHTRAPRGLERAQILEEAFRLIAKIGEADFSVRKLAAVIGVDPMTVLHHFGSKEELLRAIADRALQSIEVAEQRGCWQSDLRAVADAYRSLARRYPRVFHLHFRFHATGPADHASSELVYRALIDAGLEPTEAAGIGLAFYAFVLGFAQAEIEGLLRPIAGAEAAELAALNPEAFPATRALLPAFRALNSDDAFKAAIDCFIGGIANRCAEDALRSDHVFSSKT
jgi:AcrR family transcriptional regulator